MIDYELSDAIHKEMSKYLFRYGNKIVVNSKPQNPSSSLKERAAAGYSVAGLQDIYAVLDIAVREVKGNAI